MGFKAVYRKLLEVFPDVDSRILKATAIEHCKDADAAVEFVLEEVLPVKTPHGPPSSVGNKSNAEPSFYSPMEVSHTPNGRQDIHAHPSSYNTLGVSRTSGRQDVQAPVSSYKPTGGASLQGSYTPGGQHVWWGSYPPSGQDVNAPTSSYRPTGGAYLYSPSVGSFTHDVQDVDALNSSYRPTGGPYPYRPSGRSYSPSGQNVYASPSSYGRSGGSYAPGAPRSYSPIRPLGVSYTPVRANVPAHPSFYSPLDAYHTPMDIDQDVRHQTSTRMPQGPHVSKCNNSTDTSPSFLSPLEEVSQTPRDCQDAGHQSHGLVQNDCKSNEVADEANIGSSLILKSVPYTCSDGVQAASTVQSVNNSDDLNINDKIGLINSEVHQFVNGGSKQNSHAVESSKINDLDEPYVSGSITFNGSFQNKSSSDAVSNEVKTSNAEFLDDPLLIYEDTKESAEGRKESAEDAEEVAQDTEEFAHHRKECLEDALTVSVTSCYSENKELDSTGSLENPLEQVVFDNHNVHLNTTAENGDPDLIGSMENASGNLVFDNQSVDIEAESSHTSIVTQSQKACSIDLLEDAINEAKNNKKTLFSSMESVISLMREVELQEKAAEEAKEEAITGGLDILAKAEDIKQMLEHAKEANDMHAGEVYGEKAILATEARELQSRLLNLSAERDKSLAILNEMRESLEARLLVAEEVIKAAENEKLEKEESARRTHEEQELIMEKVVEESKRIQEEADENSKLRSFLMDRGHVVDILQGEIAVICLDVKLLKENFDGRLPISKSLSSSQTSCILASSGSSCKFVASDRLTEQIGSLLETIKRSGTSSPVGTSVSSSSEMGTRVASSPVGRSPRSSSSDEGMKAARKVLDDDGWEFFDI